MKSVLKYFLADVLFCTPRKQILSTDEGQQVPPQPLLSCLGFSDRNSVLLEDSFLTTEEGQVRCFTSPYSTSSGYTQTPVLLLLAKMKMCHPMMGYLPPNHDVGRVMASLYPWNFFLHLTGSLSINFVVLVVVPVLNGEDFLIHEEDVFVPILSMPLEEMLCSCPLDCLQSRSNYVSL